MRLKFHAFVLASFLTVPGQAPAQPPAPPAPRAEVRSMVAAGMVVKPVTPEEPGADKAPAGMGRRRGRDFQIAPNSCLAECSMVLTGGSSLRAAKAELRGVDLKLEWPGTVDLSRCLVSNFSLAGISSRRGITGDSGPGPNFSARDCLITGKLDLPAAHGSMARTEIDRVHFVKTGFADFTGVFVGMLSFRQCHFEKCVLPLSLAVRMTNCTFEACHFTMDLDEKRVPAGFAIAILGALEPSEQTALSRMKIAVKPVKEAAFRFWSPWMDNGSGEVITEHQIAFGPERHSMPVSLPAAEPVSVTAAKVEGVVYRARGVPVQLRFEKGLVEMLSRGSVKSGGTVSFSAGGKILWTDTEGTKGGWFSSDYSLLVLEAGQPMVCERAEPDKEFGGANPAGEGIGGSNPLGWLLGSTWEFEGKSLKRWLRFESPGYCVWLDSTGLRGSGNCHPFRDGKGFLVKDWPATGDNGVLLWDKGKQALTMEDQGVQLVGFPTPPAEQGEGLPVLSAPSDGGLPNPAAGQGSSGQAAVAESAGKAPGPSVLKAQSSEITGLLSKRETMYSGVDGAAYRLSAVVTPAAGGFEAPVTFLQYGNFSLGQKEIRPVLVSRHQAWPLSVEINISHQGGPDMKAGSSVDLPAALLVEGLYTGMAWDPGFCATGCLAADGTVLRVSGLPEKLSAAALRKCRIAGIPLQNEAELRDYFLLKGPAALVNLQVIGVEKFDNAVVLARADRSGNILTAVNEFAKITTAAPGGTALAAWLKSPPVVVQLEKVTAAEPRHLGAKLLLELARGKPLGTLTMESSVDGLIRQTGDILSFQTVMQDPFQDKKVTDLAGWKSALEGLRRFKSLCHSDLRPLLDQIVTYGTRRLEMSNSKPKPVARPSRPTGKSSSEPEDLDAMANRLQSQLRGYGNGQKADY